ncbi:MULTISPECIES: DUF4189 domain-containing protein [Stenotrophomonas]|uniref:DUF4189 domain-containing protein n=2 Tax=Stenotrophomonas TaxID=40323 RepID=UPI001F166846|nr:MULTISPECIES: DUF4189 domain-containing protein [Stenotrophomonas]MDZ5834730.1 DUF4189 domain-containing protein [Stenotrophomonas maltophilia]
MNCGLGVVAATLRFKTVLIHHQRKMEIAMNWMHPLSLGLLLCLSSSANAASAIVYDEDGRYGYSLNQNTLSAAMQRALQHCAVRSRNCAQTATTTAVGYSAIATGTVAMGFALGEKTADAAQRKADRMCRQRANDCTLAILWRETPSGIAPPAHPGHAVPEPRLYSSPEVGQDAAGSTH